MDFLSYAQQAERHKEQRLSLGGNGSIKPRVLYQIYESLKSKELVPQIFSPANVNLEREKKNSQHSHFIGHPPCLAATDRDFEDADNGKKSYLFLCQLSQLSQDPFVCSGPQEEAVFPAKGSSFSASKEFYQPMMILLTVPRL